MNPVRRWVRDVFGFSGTEINGFLILLPLMVVIVFSEPLYRHWLSAEERPNVNDARKLDSLLAVWNTPSDMPPPPQPALFKFDPNTATVETLRMLGFDEISAKRIAAYRRKGGVFTTKSDLLKIYGLDSTLYEQLYKYITLPSRRVVSNVREAAPTKPETAFSGEQRIKKDFDLNLADTITFKAVYGIGSLLAARIVRFRDALGGFVRKEQLYEVYGLDSLVVRRLLEMSFIKADFEPQQIDLNLASERELSRHPYINYRTASLLTTYRYQHGDFLEVGDIKKLSGIKPEEFERFLPYLKVSKPE